MNVILANVVPLEVKGMIMVTSSPFTTEAHLYVPASMVYVAAVAATVTVTFPVMLPITAVPVLFVHETSVAPVTVSRKF